MIPEVTTAILKQWMCSGNGSKKSSKLKAQGSKGEKQRSGIGEKMNIELARGEQALVRLRQIEWVKREE
jgi:hypothetical protein